MELPDVSSALTVMRDLLQAGKYQQADGVLIEALHEKGYEAASGKVLPLADLRITMPNYRGFRHYRRSLNMTSGEVSVRWEDNGTRYRRRAFVSRVHDLLACEIAADEEPFAACLALTLHDPEDSRSPLPDEGLRQSMQVQTAGDFQYYAVRNDDGTDFGAVMRVVPEDGTLSQMDDIMEVRGASKALILVKTFVKGERQTAWAYLREELQAVCDDYEDLLAAHAEIHGALFTAATITLSESAGRSNEQLLQEAYNGEPPAELMEKMWAYGRYLFISAVRPDGLPCALYGLWCGDYNPMWCEHILNENVEMIHCQAATGGLLPLLMPLFDYYDALRADARENAKKLFGCRGIQIHGYTAPGMGLTNVLASVIVNWTGGAGWLARHFYDYYLYTGDVDFLRRRALPFLREAALFYEDFLTTSPDGKLTVSPSVSPENSPGRFWHGENAMTHPTPTTINATIDFAIIKELLRNLVEGAQITGMFTGDIPKWERMLSRIPAYQLNEDGAVREWMHPDLDDHYNHRHLSHLYPIFPGQEVTREEQPELFAAFMTAVRKRLAVGLNDQSGWSLAHMACIFARMEMRDAALECLELLARSCLTNNLFTLHNDWRQMGITLDMARPPVQLDANMGWTHAMQEMLLYASPRLVRLLPALPGKWRRGKTRGLHFYTGFVEMTWDLDKGLFRAALTAERDTQVLLKLPALFTHYRYQGTSVMVSPAPEFTGQYVEIRIPAGERLMVEAG